MTQLEFYKSFQFMIELLLAEGMFLFRLRRRRLFWLRLVLALAACFGFACVFPVRSATPAYLSCMFLLLFLFTVCAAKFIFKERWLKIAFCCVAGYTVQHMTYQLNYITLVAMLGGDPSSISGGMYGESFLPTFTNPFLAVWYCFVIFFVYSVVYWVFGSKLARQEFKMPSAFGFFLICLLLFMDIVLNMLVLYYLSTPAGIIIAGTYNVLCCVLGLFLQFEVLLRWGVYSQLRMLQIVSRQERERYAAVKEAMETVNIKCHDLKHQIRRFRNKNLVSESVAADIEKAISDYAAITFTGCSVLDMVLTEINRTCARSGIRASYMADGKLLSFMSDEDIYILFSNLLDNAVEAVMQCAEDKRTMGLRVEKRGMSMVSVTVYNYCGREHFDFADGLPVTTKARKDIHGFGLRSVRRISEKYGAALDICPEDGFFNVHILFPRQEAAA